MKPDTFTKTVSRGRITIDLEMRKAWGIKDGAQVTFKIVAVNKPLSVESA